MWNGWLRVAQRLSCGVRAFPYPEPGSRQASQWLQTVVIETLPRRRATQPRGRSHRESTLV
jgi:hypothetical protein